MCGIAGIIGTKEIENQSSLVQRMIDRMEHRGPDSGDIYKSENIVIGHRRLSIIDLSSEANQPFQDSSKRYTIVFNGEIYNFQSVKSQLKNDYSFKTSSDTEVILAAYIKWGEKCVEHFNGMFALAIWDNSNKQLFVARDRMGIKPFYYFYNPEEELLVFASELRSILSTNLVKKQLNKETLNDYLSYQTVHSPNTIIKNIFQLEPGKYGVFKNGKFKTSSYWSISPKKQIDLNLNVTKAKVKSLFFEAVERRLVSDVSLGAFLSGGIDSSAVVAAMANVSSQPIHTFSVGFTESEFDESEYASFIANKYKTEHTKFELTANSFLDELPQIIKLFDTPSGDGVNTFIVSKLVKNAGLTVALSGLGGDELFAGYDNFTRYSKANQFSWLWKIPTPLRKGFAKIYFRNNQSKLRELIEAEKFQLSNIYPISRRVLANSVIKDLIDTDFNSCNDYLKEKIDNYSDINTFTPLTQVSISEIIGYTQNVLLRDTDQMSMANSLEVRVPFFDHELVEFVLSIKDNHKYPHIPKKLLVDSLNPLIPENIVNRKKMGFTLPWEHWMKNELKSLCEENLSVLYHLTSCFKEKSIRYYWNQFLLGNPQVKWSHLWTLVILGAWIKENEIEA
ncbi:asparagine synthase (glutamine-hydrolyzing) [bacterium]|nr:asparagine synthase (glutamine-hydrolyzing) [bacterium]